MTQVEISYPQIRISHAYRAKPRIWIPFLTTSLKSDLALAIALLPLFWATGTVIFAYHLIALMMGIKTLFAGAQNGKVHIAPAAFLILFYLAAYATSIAVNWGYFGQTRSLTSVHNATFWAMGLLVFLGVSNIPATDIMRCLFRPAAFICIVAGLIALAAPALWIMGFQEFYIRTPINLAVGNLDQSGLFQSSTVMKILQKDWILGRTWPRSVALAPYATALAATLAMMLPFALFSTPSRRGGKTLRTIALVLGVFALFAAASRVTIFGFALALATVLVIRGKRRIYYFLLLIPLLGLLAPLVPGLLESVNSIRGGSSEHRFSVYEYGINLTIRESPFLGFGSKPRLESFNVPIGSHSMYVGTFFKAGLLGLFALVLFQGYVLLRLLQRISLCRTPADTRFFSALGVSLLTMAMWLLTEDIDAPHFVCFAYFALVGVLENFARLRPSGQISIPSSGPIT